MRIALFFVTVDETRLCAYKIVVNAKADFDETSFLLSIIEITVAAYYVKRKSVTESVKSVCKQYFTS